MAAKKKNETLCEPTDFKIVFKLFWDLFHFPQISNFLFLYLFYVLLSHFLERVMEWLCSDDFFPLGQIRLFN